MTFPRLVFARLAVASMLLIASTQAATDRDWHTGTVTTSGNQKDGPVVNNIQRQDVQGWIIDAGDKMYLVSQVRRMMGGTAASWHIGKLAPINVGDTIKFSVHQNDFFVLASDGKEWKLHVDRVSMKP